MTTKTAFVAIVGRPNIGKSTLLNRMVGEKVSITSNKPQTTRNKITGVVTHGDTQLIFLDTPGWHKGKTRLSNYMVREIKDTLLDVELALFLTDPVSGIREEEKELLKNLTGKKVPTILLLNKVDTLKDKENMIPKLAEFSKLYDFEEMIPISAATGEGVDELVDIIKTYAVESPHYFDSDQYTDQPERVIVAEIVREKLLNNLRDELPHGTAVFIEQMSEREDGGMMDIHVTIVCEKASHKGMIIGKQGAMLKTVATQARQDIEEFLDCKVNLQCWVKVKEDWRNRENIIKQFGFE